MTTKTQTAATSSELLPWLEKRNFTDWRQEFDHEGYLTFERVLTEQQLKDIRATLKPHLEVNLTGRR